MARKKADAITEKTAKTPKKAVKPSADSTEQLNKAAKPTKKAESSAAKSQRKSTKTPPKSSTTQARKAKSPQNTAEPFAETVDNALLNAAARLDAMEAEEQTTAAQFASTAADTTAAQIIYSLDTSAQIFVKTATIVSGTGKTKSWVRDLVARGIIQEIQTKHGKLFDLVQTMRDYCAYLEDRQEDSDAAEADLKKKKAEAKLKESKAAIAEMQAKEFQGKMHRSEDVQKMTADLLYFVRGGLVALAGRCANDCAASSEPAVIQKIIEREVREILKDLSEYKYDPKRYDELVRQRTNRELDADFGDSDDEE